MKRIAWWMVAVCSVALASPALAGAPGAVQAGASSGKCTRATQACLNQWAKQKDLPWAGIQYDEGTGTGPLSIKAVAPGGPAATAGIQAGDILVALNGVKITDKEVLKKSKSEWKVGQTVQFTISRTGTEQQLPLTPIAMPPDVFAASVGAHMLENHVPLALAEAGTSEGAVKAVKAEKK